MLLGADGCLRAVGMRWEKLGQQSLELLVSVVGEADIVLLIDGLQLGVEATNHHVLEAVGLNLGPVLHFVGRNFLDVAGHIVGGEGIRALAADSSHQLVVLVGDEVLGCELRDAVYLMVHLLARSFVGRYAIFLISTLDVVQ